MFFKSMLFVICISAMFLCASMEAAADICSEPVQTASGLVRGAGEEDTGTCVWRGIPYAAPPTGELRWRAPQPAPSWPGVRDAIKWGDRCMQGKGLLGGGGYEGAGMSEDCLYLNIWRPKKPGRYPVMFWVHGGGYYVGSGSDPQYRGDRLSEAGDVIVVTINYRLTLFGFMAHPALRDEDPNGSTGGYGIMDQAYALKWVNDNIGSFGGDPENITIFGQSAGGAAICTLVATPLARGLFHKAIVQSGPCELSRDLEEGYQQTMAAMEKLGCGPHDLECMRGLSADEIRDKAAGSLLEGFQVVPCHDGHVLLDTPLAMIEAGNYARVPFMTGSVLDEFGKAVKIKPANYHTRPAKYEKRLVKGFGMPADAAEKLVDLYPLDQYDDRPVEAMGRMFGADFAIQCPAYRAALAISGDGNETYFYRFDYHGQRFGKYMGSFHTVELPFIFGSFDRPPAKMLYDEERKRRTGDLSMVMQAYWTNFAKTGDPNGEGLPEWASFEPSDPGMQILDVNNVRNVESTVADRCDFWEDYSEDFRREANDFMGDLF